MHAASVEKRNAAGRQKNPACGGPWELIGCVPPLARCGLHRAARRAWPNELPWPIKYALDACAGRGASL